MSETAPPPTNPFHMRAAVEARIREETEKLGRPEKPEAKSTTSDFVFNCLNNNELGDGVLFTSLHRGKYLFDASAGEWLVWKGHHWERDITGRAQAAVEDVAMLYVKEGTAIARQIASATGEEEIEGLQKKQNRLYRRVDRLRSVHRQPELPDLCSHLRGKRPCRRRGSAGLPRSLGSSPAVTAWSTFEPECSARGIPRT